MNLLAIDIGNYSIKFFETKLQRKALVLEGFAEIIIDEVKDQFSDDLTIDQLQHKIVSQYIVSNEFEGKVIFALPSLMITSRFFNLPVTNRKKAEQMIPFQLDDNLPFSIADTHYTYELLKKQQYMSAMVTITELNDFEIYQQSLDANQILPNQLTSELSIIQNHIQLTSDDEAFCLLDIGHSTTKAYFIYNKQIVSNHISYTSGETITEVIHKTYQIPYDEAVKYKHKNCFFLTESQYPQVKDDQKEFALLMKETLSPFIQELKRWILGFRVKHIDNIEKIYITGGTSNINNIGNFIADSVKVPVQPFNFKQLDQEHDLNISNEENSVFTIAKMISYASISRTPLSNFLIGLFSSASSSSLPIYSTIFISTRVLFISVFIIFALTIEGFILKDENQVITLKIRQLLKTKILNIPAKKRREFNKSPRKILSYLEKKHTNIETELEGIINTTNFNSLDSLAYLSKKIARNTDVIMEHFETNGKTVSAQFLSSNSQLLEKIENTLKTAQLKKLKIKYSNNRTQIDINYEE